MWSRGQVIRISFVFDHGIVKKMVPMLSRNQEGSFFQTLNSVSSPSELVEDP